MITMIFCYISYVLILNCTMSVVSNLLGLSQLKKLQQPSHIVSLYHSKHVVHFYAIYFHSAIVDHSQSVNQCHCQVII